MIEHEYRQTPDEKPLVWIHTVCLECGCWGYGYSMNEVCPNDGSELLRLDDSIKAANQTSKIAGLVGAARRLKKIEEALA